MSCCPTDKCGVVSDMKTKSVISYSVGPVGSERALLFVYDIFGISPQVRKVADILSENLNCRVVIPDIFDGDEWPIAKFPPSDSDAFMKWLNGYDKETCKGVLSPFIDELKAQGAKKIGIVGYCWGARITYDLFNEGMGDSVALVHPSFLDDVDFDKPLSEYKGGVAILRTGDDPVMQKTKDLYATSTDGKFVFEDFNSMHHGFMAARGDFKNKEQWEQVCRGLVILTKFFNDTL